EGETLAEVTTDKVDVEVPAPATGTVVEILAAEGATVEVGAVLATISVSKLDARRRELNLAISAAGQAGKVSFTHLIGYAIARGATEMPEMTAHFARTPEGKPARIPGGAHLGIAVDSRRADGTRFLVVPVIRDAGTRQFNEFREEY